MSTLIQQIILHKSEILDCQGYAINLTELIGIDENGFMWKGYIEGRSGQQTIEWYLLEQKFINNFNKGEKIA